MKLPIPSNNMQFALTLTLQAKNPTILRIITSDRDKPYTKYSDRFAKVDGIPRPIYLAFPQSPRWLDLSIVDTNKQQQNNISFVGNPAANGKLIPYKASTLRLCDVWMDADTQKFVDFAQLFSKNAGILVNGQYADNSGKFNIDYQDFVYDRATNKMVNTPARIGHKTGLINVSRLIFQDFTVPQRFIILLHEFSHKYINPKFGREMENEFAADINALYIYLGLGYPPIDARYVYLKVFTQPTVNYELSMRRYAFIDDFINKFEAGKMAKCNKSYQTKK